MKKITFLLLFAFFMLSSAFAVSSENLYVVGDACSSGWNPGGALEMTKESEGVFTWTGVLKKNSGSGERFKFLVARSWSVSVTCRLDVDGHLLITSGTEYDIFEKLETDGKPDNSFQVSETAIYTVDVNLTTMKMTCTKTSDYEEPDLNLFTRETLQTTSGEILNYRKLVPPTVEAGTKYPLVIFLHGAGERGSDNNNQLTHGGAMFVKTANRNTYPAYVLFPQCPSNYFWPFNSQPSSYDATTFPVDYPISSANKQVKELIDTYLEMDEIDKDRVYIMGISMGAMGTFDMVCRYPEIFAATIPICGGVNVARLTGNVKNVYWRLFHGNADGVVTVNNSREANQKLIESGADVEYIEYPGVDHDSWTQTFAREDFLPWLFSKTRKSISNSVETINDSSADIYYYNNSLYINTNETGTLKFNLYTISGALIYSHTDNTNATQYQLPTLNKGIYIVEIQQCNGKVIQKIKI